MIYYLIFLGLFAVRKVLDQRKSKRMVKELSESRKILPTRDRAYPWLLATHIVLFLLTPLEVILLERRFIPALGYSMMGLFLGATLLRGWATASLGRYWSSKVAVPEDMEPVTTGPYRFVRHPNYLAMSLEMIAVGLMYSAFLSTLMVTVLNAVAVLSRIRSEEEVLFQIPEYRRAMEKKARLIPGIY